MIYVAPTDRSVYGIATMASRKKTPAQRRRQPSVPKPGSTRTRTTTAAGAGPTGDSDAAAGPENTEASKRRAHIRHSAFTCFAERGFHETSLSHICKEAGISRGSFYWHFESKESVFLEILELWVEEVKREVRAQFSGTFSGTGAALAKPGTPPPNARDALLAALAREGKRGRRVIPLWLDGLLQARQNPALRETLGRLLSEIRGSMADVIRPSFAPYHAPEEIDQLAGLLFSCFIGAISQEMAEPGPGLYDHQVEQLLTTTDRFAELVRTQGLDHA